LQLKTTLAQLQQTEAMLVQEREARAALELQTKDQVEALARRIKELEAIIASLRADSSSEVQKLQAEMSTRESKFQADLKALKDQYELDLQRQRSELERKAQDEMNKLAAQQDYFKNCLKEEFQAKLTEQKNQFEETIRGLQARLSNQAGESNKALDSVTEELRKSKLQFEKATADYMELQKLYRQSLEEVSTFKSQVDTLKRRIEGLEADLGRARESGANQSSALSSEVDRLKRELADTVREWQSRLDLELRAKADQMARDLALFEETRRRDTQSHQQEIDQLKSKFQSDLQAKEREHLAALDSLRAQLKQVEEDWSAKYKDLEGRNSQRARDLESMHGGKLAEQVKVFEEREAKLNADWQNKLEKLRAQLQAEKETELLRAEELKKKELQQQAKVHEGKLQQFSRDFDEQLARKIAEYEEAIKTLKVQFAGEKATMEQMIRSHTEKTSALEGQIRTLSAKLESSEQAYQKESQARAFAEAKARESEEKITQLRSQMEDRINKMSEDFRVREKDLTSKWKHERDGLIKEHLEAMAQMQRDLNSTTQLMEERYRELEGKYLELQDMYDNRPSKEEDLALIKHLQEEVTEKDAALKKAFEDMKFYKLELINREENYNKLFGAKPTVGVFNPLANKTQPGKSPNPNVSSTRGLPSATTNRKPALK